jgi:hypothetical protein
MDKKFRKQGGNMNENTKYGTTVIDSEIEDALEVLEGPIVEDTRKKKKKRNEIVEKYLYYRGKKVPIMQYQKDGYEYVLKLLLKENWR